MKNVFILILFMALASATMAQKGSCYIGGLIGYGSSTQKDPAGFKTTTSTWAFAPEIGTFLKDDIQLGIALGLTGSTSTFEGTEYASTSGFNPTIYARKFHKITDNFSTFAGLYINIISSTDKETKNNGDVEKTENSGFGANLGVGVAYALSPRFTAVGQYGMLGYQSVSGKKNGVDTGTQSDFNFGVNTVGGSSFAQGNGSGAVFNIGIYYTFKQSK